MCLRLHGSFAEAAAQQRAEVAENGLAADDEDPGIHNGVEGVETESGQVLRVPTKWMNGVDKTCNSERQGADHKDDGDECQQHQVVHFLFAVSEPGQAQPPLPPHRRDGAAPHYLAPVHLAQTDNHRPVAHEHREDQQRHEGGVGQRESQHQVGLVVPGRVHVDEAPRSRAILSKFTIAEIWQEAECQRKEVNQEKGDFSKAAADVHGVKIREADGQAALHGHGAQDERRRQAEEAHGESKEVTELLIAQRDQGHVPSVADEDGRAEQAGAQQVGEGQAGHQDAEDRGPGAMLLLVHAEDEESQQVSHHAGQEHDDAGSRFAVPTHNAGGAVT